MQPPSTSPTSITSLTPPGTTIAPSPSKIFPAKRRFSFLPERSCDRLTLSASPHPPFASPIATHHLSSSSPRSLRSKSLIAPFDLHALNRQLPVPSALCEPTGAGQRDGAKFLATAITSLSPTTITLGLFHLNVSQSGLFTFSSALASTRPFSRRTLFAQPLQVTSSTRACLWTA